MKWKREKSGRARRFAAALGVLVALAFVPVRAQRIGDRSIAPSHQAAPASRPTAPGGLTFSVAADMRNFTAGDYAGDQYFRGVLEAMKKLGVGAFLLSPGDVGPPAGVRHDIDEVLGKDFIWYPLPGNHDEDTASNMTWLRQWGAKAIPHLVRRGPDGAAQTMYSFDWANVHLVALNEYYVGPGKPETAGGEINAAILDWLKTDLGATRQPVIFVSGHEPINAFPDMDSGRIRHVGDSLDRDPATDKAFEDLLKAHHVVAFICGHTHNCSIRDLGGGLWQLAAGHARGDGDTGSPSTFLRVKVTPEGKASVEAYRRAKDNSYPLRGTWKLD